MPASASGIKSNLHKAARRYAKQGTSVFPCEPLGKKPLTENGFKAATTDLDQIDAWWEKWPNANIAFVPASNGQCVLDLDGEAGLEAWSRIQWEEWADHAPATHKTRTPRGGLHLRFKGDLPPSASKLAKSVDTRGHGSYVLLSPSVTEHGTYEVIDDREPAPLPQWIADKLATRAEPVDGPTDVPLDQSRNIRQFREYVAGELKKNGGAEAGSRNNSAHKLAAWGLDCALSRGMVFQVLSEPGGWNDHCKPPMDLGELRYLCDHATRQNTGSPKAQKSVAESFPKVVENGAEFEEQLISRRGDEIELKATTWLWPLRFPQKRVSLLAGHGDVGKTTLLLDITARITSGAAWPDDSGNAPLGNVVYMSSEDDAEETLMPRFIAAKGDPKRIHIVDGVRGEDGRRTFSIADDLKLLEKKIREIGDVALVIFDPINSYFGDTDTFKASRVRAVLEPLMPLAKKHDVAIIGNTHFNKAAKGGGSANMRILDSQAISNFVRSIYVVNKDPEDEHARLFLRSKGNLGKPVDGLRFYFKERFVKEGLPLASYVDWTDDVVKASADSTLRANEGEGPKRTKIDDAMDFFRETLMDGPQPTNKVMKAGIAEGHTDATLRVARRRLGLQSIPPARPSERGGVWTMALPGSARPPKLKLIVNSDAEDW